jgi:hypothetical protein
MWWQILGMARPGCAHCDGRAFVYVDSPCNGSRLLNCVFARCGKVLGFGALHTGGLDLDTLEWRSRGVLLVGGVAYMSCMVVLLLFVLQYIL